MSRPDFFIVGAPKSGTTAMTEYLAAHPQIFMLTAKELHYFGSDLATLRPRPTSAEYLAYFADSGSARRVGEASTGYLYSAAAPREMLDFSPGSDALMMLRNPIDLVRSLHEQQLFMGQEDITDLGAALDAEPDRAAGRRIPAGCDSPWAMLYTRCALYAEPVERYFDTFGRDHVSVTIFDDFEADVAGAYGAVTSFLGVDATFRPDFPVVNARKQARSQQAQKLIRTPPGAVRGMVRRVLSPERRVRLRRALYRLNTRGSERPELDEQLRRRLVELFAPDVARLSGLLGRDLSGWLAAR